MQHAFKDGSREEVKLRHLGAADGSTVIAKNVRCGFSLITKFDHLNSRMWRTCWKKTCEPCLTSWIWAPYFDQWTNLLKSERQYKSGSIKIGFCLSSNEWSIVITSDIGGHQSLSAYMYIMDEKVSADLRLSKICWDKSSSSIYTSLLFLSPWLMCLIMLHAGCQIFWAIWLYRITCSKSIPGGLWLRLHCQLVSGIGRWCTFCA